jgi:hypothetical protein
MTTTGIAIYYDSKNEFIPSYKEIPITDDIVVPKNTQIIYADYDEELDFVSVTILSTIDTECNLRFHYEPFSKFWFKLKLLLGITTEIKSALMLNYEFAQRLFKNINILNEDTSEFTQSISLIESFPDGSGLFHVGCDCGMTEHTHTVFIDTSEKEILIGSHLSQGHRHRQLESSILLKPSGAANYAKLLSF